MEETKRSLILYRFDKPVIIIHGGAGNWNVDSATRERILRFLKDLVKEVFDSLERDYNALDAVEHAVSRLEDSGLFNAGYGSALNIRGFVEMDAGIMDGSSMRAGAVAMIRDAKNPVKIAREIMIKTDHVILGGLYDEELRKIFHIERRHENPDTIKRYKDLISSKSYPSYYKKNLDIIARINLALGDTVGAVALDKNNRLAAATSTGGIWLKLPGRIGDSPIPGAGFYADRNIACSATGVGETILSVSLCRTIALHYRYLRDLSLAVSKSFDELEEFFGTDTAGVITLSTTGDSATCYNTRGMARGYMSSSL
ncbi:MAG: isoaspartyl peptidase/L-asparaginase, partial [Sulfolobales archaeon]